MSSKTSDKDQDKNLETANTADLVLTPETLLPTKEIVAFAQKAGVNFGTGNPEERIRYYIKLGLLPNALRRATPQSANATVGHHPFSVIATLKHIDLLKKKGLSYPQISEKFKKAAESGDKLAKKESSQGAVITEEEVEQKLQKHRAEIEKVVEEKLANTVTVPESESQAGILGVPAASPPLYPTKKIIEIARSQGVDFGAGNPEERIRYFIKLGMLPFAIRKSTPEQPKATIGHLPLSVITTIKLINRLKQRGLSYPKIAEKIKKAQSRREEILKRADQKTAETTAQTGITAAAGTDKPSSFPQITLWRKQGLTDNEIEKKLEKHKDELELKLARHKNELKAEIEEIEKRVKGQDSTVRVSESDLKSLASYNQPKVDIPKTFKIDISPPVDNIKPPSYPIKRVAAIGLASLFLVVGAIGSLYIPYIAKNTVQNAKTSSEVAADITSNLNEAASVLAASSEANFLYIDATTEVKGETTFLDDITAPNVVYGVTGGTGISVTAGQNPVVSLSATGIVTSVNTSSGALTVKGGGATTVSTSGSTITITSTDTKGETGLTSESDTLATVTGRGATSATAITLSGALTVSTAGAASTPAELLSGTWFTTGTATTNKPQLLIEPASTTSTGWSTSGTGLGINSASAFAGNLIDAQVGGSSVFNIAYTGNVILGKASTTTGSLTFADASNAFTTTIQQSTSSTASATYTLPVSAPGTSGYLLSSATTGVLSWIAPGSVGTSWSSLTDPSTSLSLTFDDGEVNTFTVSSDTEDFWTFTASSITTGSLFVATGPTTTGVTDHFIKVSSDVGSNASLVNLNPDFSGSGVTGYGTYNTATDATGNTNTDYGYYGSLTLTGNAAKNGYGVYSTISSSSTTGDTLISFDAATTVTGALGGATTRNVYGVRSLPTSGAESTAGTTNIYGLYSNATGDVSAGGTFNAYGLYVANGTYDTEGTSTTYGIYVESQTGADNSYAAVFAGGNVGIGDTSPSATLEIGDGTDSIQFSSVGDITFVDANGAASITGPAGGALSVLAGASQALTITANLGSTWSTSNGVLTISGDDGLTLTAVSTAGVVVNTVDAITNALDIQEGSNNYININTSNSSENIAFGNAVTNPSFSFLGTGAVTIAGSAEGTASLTQTAGDHVITDGDLTISGGEIAATTDDTAGTAFNFVGNTITTGTAFALSATAVTTGKSLDITSTSAPADASTNENIDINITHTPTGSADNFRSIDLDTSDGTALANTVYNLDATLTLTGNAAKVGYGVASAISSTSTTADTLYGGYFTTSHTGQATGGTANTYAVYAQATGDVSASGAINNYGVYVANGTYDTEGTNTAFGINIEDISGADTNIDLNFTGSPTVRIGDAGVLTFTEAGGNNTLCTLTDSSNLGNLSCTGNITGSTSGTVGFWTRTSTTLAPATANDIVSIPTTNTSGADLAITNTGIYTGSGLVTVTANSATSGDIVTISTTALSSGTALTITGPSTTGVTDDFIKVASDVGSASLLELTPDFSGSGVTGYGLNITGTDATTAGNTDYGVYSTISATGQATSGNRNIYAIYAQASGDVSAGGTINNYGVYVANGTYDTQGTNSAYGLYIASITGADTNYAIYSEGGQSYHGGSFSIGGDATPESYLDVGNGTDELQVSSTGDITFVDADGGASITGPNGGALSIAAANSTDLALSTTTAGNITLTTAAAAGLVNVLTGNLKVGGGTPGLTLNADDAYITGTLEADANVQFDSNTQLGDSNTADTLTGTLLTSAFTSGATTQTVFSVASTTLTTGESFDITATHAPADGLENEAIDINITHTPTVSADTFQAINLTTTDGTALGSTVYNLKGTLTLTGNAAKTGYGIASAITSTSTTADTLYGGYFTTSHTGQATGGTVNTYAVYAQATGDVSAGGTINNYGVYVANGTYDTEGTNIAYGINIEDITGADTNIDLNFTGSPIVRIGDAGVLTFTEAGGNNTLCTLTDSANLGNLSCTGNITGSTSGTVGFWTRTSTTLSPATANDIVAIANTTTSGADFAVTNTGIYTGTGLVAITANSANTGDILTLSATGLTSGTALTLTGSSSTGVTDHFVKVTADVGSAAALIYGAPDFSGSGVTGYGLNITGTDPTTSANTNYGVYSSISAGGEATSGTRNLYAIYALASGDVSAGGAFNTYGLYVANGTYDTEGTSTTYGIYVESQTGADNSYAAVFAGGNVGIGDTSPSAQLEVGDGTDSIQFSSVGDITFVDANGAASITGPAGGAFSVVAGSGQALTLTANGTSVWSTTAGGLTVHANANAINLTLSGGDNLPTAVANGNDVELTAEDDILLTPSDDITATLAAGGQFIIDGSTTASTGTAGVLDLNVTSATNNNKAAEISTTFTATGATTSYGVSNIWASSAVVTGAAVSQTAYDYYGTATKTGADDATGTYALYGIYQTASNTGRTAAGTVNTYGAYLSSTGDRAGTTNTYGAYILGTGADTSYGIYATATSTTTVTTGNDLYGGYFATSHTGQMTGGTVANYAIYAQATGDVSAGATVNNYGVYVASGTYDTEGTNRAIGVYIANMAGADTNVGLCFDCDGTWTTSDTSSGIWFGNDANFVTLYRSASDTLKTDDSLIVDVDLTVNGNTQLGNSNTADTLTGTLLTSTFTSGATTQTVFSVTSTTLTTGEILDITSTSAPTDGSTNEAIDINITHSPTTQSDTFTGIDVALTDSTNFGNIIYGIQNNVTVSGNQRKINYGTNSTVTSSSSSFDDLYGGYFSTNVSNNAGGSKSYAISVNATSTNTTADDVYGVYALSNHTGQATTGASTVYGVYTKATGDVSAGATISNYGVYVANGTYDTEGTNTAFGLYIEDISGADTNIDVGFSGSPIVRIGDAGVLTFTEAGGNNTLCTLTDSANLGNLSCTGNITGSTSGTVGFWTRTSTTLSPATANDIVSIPTTNTTGADLAITNTGVYTGTGIFNLTANSASTGNVAVISATGITSGEILDITGTFAPSGGVNEAIDINLTHSSTGGTVFSGIDLALTDATTQSNTDYGLAVTVTATGNASKDVRAIYADATSNSATGNDNLYGGYFTPTATGALTSGNRLVYGLYTDPDSGGESTTGTTSVYGLYAAASGDVSAGGTFNSYGVYVANGTFDTEGTSTAYGIYVAAISGADTNYPAYINASFAGSGGSATTGYGVYVTSTDSTTLANTDYGVYSSLTLTNDVNRNGYGVYATVSSSSTTVDTVRALLGNTEVSGAISTGTRNQTGIFADANNTAVNTGGITNLVGFLDRSSLTGANSGGTFNFASFVASSDTTGSTTGSTVNWYGMITGALITLGAVSHTLTTDGTINEYGVYIANPTSSTVGTSTKYGLYVAAQTLADTNYGMYLNTTSASTADIGFQIVSTNSTANTIDIDANSQSTADVINLSATGLTTGQAIDIAATNVDASGGTADDVIKVAVTTNNSSSAVTSRALNVTNSDATTLANLVQAGRFVTTSTGNAAKDLRGINTGVASSSTTADTIYHLISGGTVTGILSSGTRSAYGLYTNPTSTAVSTGGTLNQYGLYSAPSATGAAAGVTDTVTQNVYGGYFKVKSTLASDCTTNCTNNNYGVYIDNDATASQTNGTATKYGLYVAAQTGADTNYGAYINSGTTSEALTIVGTNTTNDVMSITASSLSTGTALTLTGPTSTGVTDHFVKITTDVGSNSAALYIAPDFSGSSVTGYGVNVVATDSTTGANSDWSVYSQITASGALSSGTRTASGITGEAIVSGIVSSTGVVNAYGDKSRVQSTAAHSGGTVNLYGGLFDNVVSNATTGSIVNSYGVYTGGQSQALTTGGTLNVYGVYIASSTMDTVGTSTQYGIYVAGQSGADTNYEAIFAGTGGVGIGDTTPDAVLDIDAATTTTPAFGITDTGVHTGTTTSSVATIAANSATSGTVLNISATGLTTGKILNIAGTIVDATGGQSNHPINIAITNTPTVSADIARSMNLTMTDSTTLGSQIVSLRAVTTNSGASDKVVYGAIINASSTSTVAETSMIGILANGTSSGVITTGTRNIINFNDNYNLTAASTGGTTNLAGFASTSTVSNSTTGSTVNWYGLITGANAALTSASHTLTTDGTLNEYGVYIANTTSSTTGTTAKYGLYIVAPTGADTNYGMYLNTSSGVGFQVSSTNTTLNTIDIDANSTTTADVINISGTALTTGQILDITATNVDADGGATDDFVSLTLTNTPTVSGNVTRGINVQLTDNSTMPASIRGGRFISNSTGNAAKDIVGVVGGTTSTSTTADTLYGGYFTTSHTGQATADTTNTYAVYAQATGDVSAGGTINNYGIYVANGTYDTQGTNNAYGLYVADLSGADKNLEAVINGGLYIGSATWTAGITGSIKAGNTNLTGFDAVSSIVLTDNAANSYIALGQGASNHLELIWAYNATPANASAQIATYGYSNAIFADGSAIGLCTINACNVGIGDSSPDYTLELSGATAPKLSMSDTGLTVGATDWLQTDVFFHVDMVTDNDGGARVWGLSDSVGQDPLRLLGAFGNTDPTDTVPAVRIVGAKRTGTALTNLGAAETLLTVEDNGTVVLRLEANGDPFLSAGVDNTNEENYLCIDTTAYEVTRNTVCNASSIRYKENISDLNYGLDTVKQMHSISFNYKPEKNMGTRTRIGFIAEEMVNVVPEVVEFDDEGLPNGIDYAMLTSVFANAIQELDIKVEDHAAFLNSNLSALVALNAQMLAQSPESFYDQDGNLNEAFEDNILTAGQINQMVTQKFAMSIEDLKAEGRLVPTATEVTEATSSSALAQQTQKTLDNLNALLAGTSATVDSLTVTGNTNLAQTQVAGTFSQDGTFIIDYGKQVNVLGSTLFLQNDGLAGDSETGIVLDIGAGNLTLDNQGNLVVQGAVAAASITITDDQVAGSSAVPAGVANVFIPTTKVSSGSKISITFTSDYSPATRYIVSEKLEGEGFTVQLDVPTIGSATFDWFIINTQASN